MVVASDSYSLNHRHRRIRELRLVEQVGATRSPTLREDPPTHAKQRSGSATRCKNERAQSFTLYFYYLSYTTYSKAVYCIRKMALRLASKKILGQVPQLTATRAFAAGAAPSPDGPAPTVFDKLISLTIVDPSGARRKIPAMVGEYLVVLSRRRCCPTYSSVLILKYLYVTLQVPLCTKRARRTKSSWDQ